MPAHTNPAIAASAVWALRHNANAADDRTFRTILNRSENPWFANEAILGLGRLGNAKAIGDLADILLATPRGRQLAAWQALTARQEERWRIAEELRNKLERQMGTPAHAYDKAYEGYEKAYERYVKLHAEWNQRYGPFFMRRSVKPALPVAPRAQKVTGQGFSFIMGQEYIYQSRLRAAAAIALGNIGHSRSVQVLLTALRQTDEGFEKVYEDLKALRRADEFSNLQKAMALMSLGKIGDVKAVPALLDTLSGRIVARVELGPEALRVSPLRGHAALALGLYARLRVTPQGLVDPPQYTKVCQALADAAANRAETSEVRSAAALALGLTRRTENLRYLQSISDNLDPVQDPTLFGYMLMARGMLADRNIIPIAKAFLRVPDLTESMRSVLGRRAAVLGLGLLGTQEVIPTLNNAWHHSYYVNRELALAYSLCEAYSATDMLIELLKTSEKPLARAFAARCLGELFIPQRPTRCGRLINGSNYALRNDRIIPFQALANEFLYYGLIPAFGEVWP
jgi:HEAT repeat protein